VTESEVEAINAEASVLMKRGIAFMDEPRREAPIDALHCFDEALALRRRVPADHSPFQGYLLAACLLNRADALIRLNDTGPLAAALASFQEAIDILRTLPANEDPRYPRRLALACQNRGLALQIQGDQEAAIESFGDAIAVLDSVDAAAIEDRDYLRAVVWLNLATLYVNLQAAESQADARDAAARAMAYVAEAEQHDGPAAAVGLQARHVLCRVCALTLSSDEGAAEEMPEDVHEATDAVDEGLALIRSWEQRGIEAFRALAVDLFRFGARVYARYQPQFLDEFVAENLDPSQSSTAFVDSPDMVMAANEARHLIPRDA
jgi:hypothetical protein